MKLSPVALAVTAAIVWGGAIFIIGGINSLVPGYGASVVSLVVSIYPGYDASGGFGDLMLGTAYAFFDGLLGGCVFALLYNGVLAVTSRGGRGADRHDAAAANRAPADSESANPLSEDPPTTGDRPPD